MSGGDRTGPEGRGPMTGRKLGFCAGYQIPGYENIGYGFRRGSGRGFIRGYGRRYFGRGRFFGYRDESFDTNYNPTYPPRLTIDQEKAYLEDAAKNLEEEIKLIRKELKIYQRKKKIPIKNPF